MEPVHGTRRTYRARCRCVSCRAANAAYEAQRRRLHAAGQRPLGSRVSAFELRSRLRRLHREGVTATALARRFGLKDPRLTRETARVTFRKVLQVRWFCRQLLLDEPHAEAS